MHSSLPFFSLTLILTFEFLDEIERLAIPIELEMFLYIVETSCIFGWLLRCGDRGVVQCRFQGLPTKSNVQSWQA